MGEKAAKAEPLAQLGFGIVAYTGMLYYMIWAFALYSLLLLPTFFFYADGDAYASVEDQSKLGYSGRTIGALGYSSYECASIPVMIDLGQFSFGCDYGYIGAVEYYGVNPKSARGSCIENDKNLLCALTNSAAFEKQITP